MRDSRLRGDEFDAGEAEHTCGAAQHHASEPERVLPNNGQATRHAGLFAHDAVGLEARAEIVGPVVHLGFPLRHVVVVIGQAESFLLVVDADAFDERDACAHRERDEVMKRNVVADRDGCDHDNRCAQKRERIT